MDSSFWGRVLKRTFINIKLYAQAELKLIGLVFILFALGIHLIGYPWPILIALAITIIDLLPVLGAGVIFIPWVLYEWFVGSSSQGWYLLALYLLVTLAKQALEPIFLGKDLELPAWLPLVLTLLCSLIFNVWGIVIAGLLIPFIAAYRQVKRENNQFYWR